MMFALTTDTHSAQKRKTMYKHLFLKYPFVLFSRTAVFVITFWIALLWLPFLPNPDRQIFFLTAFLLLPAGYLFHKKRGAFMEWSLPREKYSAVISKGHDYLYRLALEGACEETDRTPGAVRRVRIAYAIVESASMITLAIGLAAFATAVKA